jgi:hypothetical protein
MAPRSAESDNECLRTDEKREYIITYGAHGKLHGKKGGENVNIYIFIICTKCM